MHARRAMARRCTSPQYRTRQLALHLGDPLALHLGDPPPPPPPPPPPTLHIQNQAACSPPWTLPPSPSELFHIHPSPPVPTLAGAREALTRGGRGREAGAGWVLGTPSSPPLRTRRGRCRPPGVGGRTRGAWGGRRGGRRRARRSGRRGGRRRVVGRRLPIGDGAVVG